MRIAIMGTGGVGGYFGTRLALGGCDVAFIARGKHLDAIRQRGIKVESPLGDLHLPAPRATDDPADIGPVDLVLFSVKLWDTDAAAKAIAPLVGRDTAVLSLQNGVRKDDILRGVLGERAVMGGVCYIAAQLLCGVPPGCRLHRGGIFRGIVNSSSHPRNHSSLGESV